MAKLTEIAEQNLWWKHGEIFDVYDATLGKTKKEPCFFKRKDMPLNKGTVYIIRGCRQVGKTTYLKDTIKQLIAKKVPPKHIFYLSVDFFNSNRELRNALDYFLNTIQGVEKAYIFLDEITSLPDWNIEIKNLADKGVTQNIVIVATGSSSYGLKAKGELLPGRGIEDYYMKPLSFREFILQTAQYICQHVYGETSNSIEKLLPILSSISVELTKNSDIKEAMSQLAPFKKELQYFFRMYLITGGFPKSINYYLEQKFKFKDEKMESSLAETYIRDILGDLRKQNKQEIISRQLLNELINKYGSRYSFSSLAQDMRTTHVTAINYLELLKESFILSILYSYDFNKKTSRFNADKKVYFLDPLIYHSIIAYLGGKELWDVINQTLQDEELQSKIIEGIVVNHILMHQEIPYLKECETFLWFYYGRNGKEIDAVFRRNEGAYLGIEVKYQSNVDYRDAFISSPIKDYLLLSKDTIEIERTPNTKEHSIIIVPIDIFLPLLTISERNL